MLGRFSTALQQAADVLAPSPPLFDDFVYYWKKLMSHYLDVSKSKPVTIELTNIPTHLDHLLQILLKEETNTEGAVGPCLEYFLQHNLLDLLASLASSDDPPGMKQHVLQFTSKLLNQSKTIVLGHLSVYFALQRLIGLCDGSTPTASESYEIQFLLSVSGVLRRNHQAVPVFLTNSNSESSSTGGRRTSCSSSGSEASNPPRNALFTTPLVPSARASGVTLVAQPITESLENNAQVDSHTHFPLADAVMSYIDSPDTAVRLKACQAVMLLVSFPSEVRTAPLISSEASLRLIARLVLLYYTIPHTTDPSHIDDMHLSWGLDIPSNDCSTCNGCRQAALFLSWFDFCDKVLIEGNEIIAEAVAQRLSESFLEQVFTVATLHKPVTLTILTKCFKMASSVHLNNVLYDWLLCDNVLMTLLENWSSSDPDLAIETLRFFELVLEKGSCHVLHSLVLNYISDRRYLASCSNTNEDNGNESIGTEDIKPDVSEVIKCWTSVLPKEVQSCTCGYEEYIGESMRQYQAVLSRPKLNPLPPTNKSEISQGEFNEGPFISTLLASLSKIPKQPYELNLELTGVVSRLALRPEQAINEFLLCTTEIAGRKTLYSVLKNVASELASCITRLPKYHETLVEVRAALLGRSPNAEDLRNDPWIGTFESIVVVEELCKELAAISHVKLKSNNA